MNSFITDLFRKKDNLISEDQLLKTVVQARKNYKEGKCIEANSLIELL